MLHEGDQEAAAACLVAAALREVEVGFLPQARRYLAQAEKLSTGKDVMISAAVATARLGDLPQAQVLARDLDQKNPQDTFIQKYWLPVIRAAIDLRQSQPTRAIDDLQPASVLELGSPTPLTLYPVYVRGQAYLAAADPARAASEFQKMLDHSGVLLNFPIGALAGLQIARAHAHSRNLDKSRAAYEDFLKLWKDADPDIPLLRAARSEYANLPPR